ncbi:alpha/beta-hydrolase [Gyrodon lividus]|nr:alpha/beta-hydrolase [Gyrodon lividus]
MAPFVSRWGDPNAAKHALLIHGLTSSSGSWTRIAQSLAAKGYLVTAPDLLGHGCSQRGTADYTLGAFVDALRPLLEPTQPEFSLVIAHSFGSIVALALLSLLPSSRTIPVILLDPPFLPVGQVPAERQSPKGIPRAWEIIVREITEIQTIEELQAAHPLWSKEDAVWKVLSAQLCDVAAIKGVIEQNHPWSFVHLLDNIPSNIRLTILMADPRKHAACEISAVQAYSRIRTIVVEGSSHSIHREYPEIVLRTVDSLTEA